MNTSKAIAGAIVAGSSAAAAVSADGHLSVVDVVVVLGAIAAGYLGVYVAPANTPTPAPGRRRRRL